MAKTPFFNEQRIKILFGILLGFIAWKIFKAIDKKGDGKVRAQVDQSQLRPGFDANAEAVAAFNAFDGIDWVSAKRDVLLKMWYFSDAELSATYNAYQELANESLTQAIKGEWIWGDRVNRIINRLDQLGLP